MNDTLIFFWGFVIMSKLPGMSGNTFDANVSGGFAIFFMLFYFVESYPKIRTNFLRIFGRG